MRGRGRSVGLLALVLLGCSPSEPDATPPVGDAYADVVRWFVDRTPGAPESEVVFMDSLGEGFEIGLDLQATIVSTAEEFAQVRFVDDRAEALGERGETVRDDGILLSVGPAMVDGDDLTIDADEFVSADQSTSWSFHLRADENGDWVIVGTPAPTAT